MILHRILSVLIKHKVALDASQMFKLIEVKRITIVIYT